MSAQVKGWCPSAHRPMMSGDGLLVRVKLHMAQLEVSQATTLCDLAQTYGNGMIDITSRANMQIRGVSKADHLKLLTALIDAGLVDADPNIEAKRTLTVTPFWRKGDLTDRLGASLMSHLNKLPNLPDKMGVVLDTGSAPLLQSTAGDFRFETAESGALILRADGAPMGRKIDEGTAATALNEMAAWFIETGGANSGRMARHLKSAALPMTWQTAQPVKATDRPNPGAAFGGHLYGVPFGQSDAAALLDLLHQSHASYLRVTPWRMLFLEGSCAVQPPEFLSQPDPLMDMAACPGAPACAQATVETRALARSLAAKAIGTIHVSGCAKGCARQAPCDITLVGNNGRFDLVQNGRPGDTPASTGHSAADILQRIG